MVKPRMGNIPKIKHADEVLAKSGLAFWGPDFTPYPIFQQQPQSKEISLNLSMKC